MSTTVKTATISKQKVAVELSLAIWQITKNLKGRTDAEDFTECALTLFFYRFLSENLTFYLNKYERRIDPAFDYSQLTDEVAEYGREETKTEKGFYILPSQLFSNVLARAKNEPDLVKTIQQINVDIFYNLRLFKIVVADLKEPLYEEEPEFLKLFEEVIKHRRFLKLANTVTVRKKKLLKLFEAIAGIPLGNLIEETSGDYIDEILEMFELVYTELHKSLVIYYFKRYR